MPRKIETHRVNEANERIMVEAMTPPVDMRPGEPEHSYLVSTRDHGLWDGKLKVRFHNGPQTETLVTGEVREVQLKGVTVESLLAVCLDRLHQLSGDTHACAAADYLARTIEMMDTRPQSVPVKSAKVKSTTKGKKR